jgi:ATP-dependent Clp protease adaptor protein ClpS
MSNDFGSEDIFDLDIIEDQEEELKEPEMYRVILHNDHYTTMDFVVEVIVNIFNKPLDILVCFL